MVVVDGTVCDVGDDFRVRVYNDALRYKTRLVSRYNTNNRHVKKYHIQGYHGTIVTNRLRDRYAVTYISGDNKGTIYFAHQANIHYAIAEAASNMLGKIVVVEDERQMTLF